MKMLDGSYVYQNGMSLTFPGWSEYENLKRGHSRSRTAFMAMQYGNPELDSIYNDHFKSAGPAQ